jgi:hypothetical protein
MDGDGGQTTTEPLAAALATSVEARVLLRSHRGGADRRDDRFYCTGRIPRAVVPHVNEQHPVQRRRHAYRVLGHVDCGTEL